jgi:hypothetical protein
VLVPESFGLATPATANNCTHTVVSGDTLYNLGAHRAAVAWGTPAHLVAELLARKRNTFCLRH